MMEYTFTRGELVGIFLRCVVEGSLLGGVLALLLWRGHLARLLHSLGRGRSLLAVGFLLAWMAVQLVDRWQYNFPPKVSFYPLVRFAMYQYGEERSEIETYRLRAVDGEERRELNPTKLFFAVGLPSMNTRMQTLRRRLLASDEQVRAAAEREAALWAEGIGSLLESRGEAVPRAVEFVHQVYELESRSLETEQVLHTVVLARAGG